MVLCLHATSAASMGFVVPLMLTMILVPFIASGLIKAGMWFKARRERKEMERLELQQTWIASFDVVSEAETIAAQAWELPAPEVTPEDEGTPFYNN